jgi:ribonuclease P protein component
LLHQTLRLRKNKDFKQTYKKGCSIKGEYLVIYYKKNNQIESKFGFSVSKKVGNAVIRNRIKRILRECCRINQVKIVKGHNIIFVARSKIKGISYWLVEKEMLDLLNKAKLLR